MGNQVSSVVHKLSPHHNSAHHNGDTHGEEENQHRGKHQTAALQKLFEKLELTADGDNAHPGELSRATFENAFQGSVHNFGKLLYLEMVIASSTTQRERITLEQFVKVGKEILKMHSEKVLVKYYFHLFASGKEHLTQEDARQMFEIAFTMTLSSSKISHQEDERDGKIFDAMVIGLFGINKEVDVETFSRWCKTSCPAMFECIHNWVTHILTGSALPEEMERSRVPLLLAQTQGSDSICMSKLWLLSLVLPDVYTKSKDQPSPERSGVAKANGGASESLAASISLSSSHNGFPKSPSSSSVTKDPLFTSMLLLRKMARLPQCESWKVLYNSQSNGQSMNRFRHHILSYHAPNITFITFEGKNLYCLAMDRGWNEGPSKFGGADCRLIQLLPVYRVVQAGEKMVRWNERAKDLPKGIQVGCEGRAEVLRIATGFDFVIHYGVECQLYRLEMWGCGSDNALEAQKIQKKWEAGAVQREQSRKLRPYGETWEDSPDKQILQWGGVNVGNHSYNR